MLVSLHFTVSTLCVFVCLSGSVYVCCVFVLAFNWGLESEEELLHSFADSAGRNTQRAKNVGNARNQLMPISYVLIFI